MTTSHRISTSPRGGRPLVESGLVLRTRDLHGVHGFFASHTLIAADGSVIKLLIDVGETYGWVHVEHHRADHAWADPGYEISLFATPQPFGGQRWRFRCPDGFGPCEVLHLPLGADRFASRQAHGLGYRSQRLRAPARAIVRAQRIRLALGGPSDLDAPFPARPKGMWSKSYERRKGMALQAEARRVCKAV